MYLSAREFWGVVHGMVLGALFLLAYGGGLAGLYSRPDWVTCAYCPWWHACWVWAM